MAYHIGSPERGDVVVFRPPNDGKKYYVKRVIGIPGDHVIIKDGFVFITPKNDNEEIKLDEKYLNETNYGHTYKHPPQQEDTRETPFDIPEGSYFLLGDNRKGSQDSRTFGSKDPKLASVPEENIKGRVWFIALPIKKIHAIKPPMYHF
ncbi:MAG: signal peptidase I, partial [Candidatus Peribacteraceae bacterium]|nr:signal peptidase I [Candidatus Peribacteraceae bacterium]